MCTVFPPADPSGDDEGQAPEPTDPEACWARANARARSRSRRYIVHNRLRYMWVVTYEGGGLHGPDGRAQAMADLAKFARKLRKRYGALPYWYSPELHPDGHGWHANVFVPRRMRHSDVERLWGRGFVWVKDWTRDTRVAGQTFVEKLRAGASYGAKYAAKDWDAVQLAGGAHRYERAEGFDPVPTLAEVPSVADGVRLAADHLGGHHRVWWSSEDESWAGPPCAVVTAGGIERRARPGPPRPRVT